MVFKSTVGSSGGAAGVSSLNGETGDITLTSSTLTITTPSSSTINLEVNASGSIPQGTFNIIS